MEQILARQLLEAGKVVEAQLDNEIKRLDKLVVNEDDLEELRERRLQAMKNDAVKKQVRVDGCRCASDESCLMFY